MVKKVHITALAVLVAFVLVSGCKTVSDEYNEQFAAYVGLPLQDAINDFGRPDKVEDDGMDGKIILWTRVQNNVQMYLRMWTDKEGTIVRWQWRQHQS